MKGGRSINMLSIFSDKFADYISMLIPVSCVNGGPCIFGDLIYFRWMARVRAFRFAVKAGFCPKQHS